MTLTYDPGSTHIPLLAWTIVNFSNGPVLELGMGYTSTPLLHILCRKRKLVSIDDNRDWAGKFVSFDSDKHQIIYTPKWEECTFDTERWGVVFIDHAPALRRKEDIKRLIDKCDVMVVHDTEPVLDNFYKFSEIFPLFPYIYHYRSLMPNTSLISKKIDVVKIFNKDSLLNE